MANDDGAYAPDRRTITLQQALAKCDAEQAAAMKRWAAELRAALEAPDGWARVRAVIASLEETGETLAMFSATLLEKLGGA